MHSDIIPPKKHSIRQITRDTLYEEEVSEKQPLYIDRPVRKSGIPKFIISLFVSILIIGGVIYAKFSERTVLTFTPHTTTLDIREYIDMSVSDSKTNPENTSLGYSLIYISSKGADRNPFIAATTTNTASPLTSTSLKPTELVATTTGAKMQAYIVNTTGASLPLRATTRFDVNGVTYSITDALTVPVTADATLFKTATKYYLPGFKNTAQAQSIYAVAVADIQKTQPSTTAPAEAATISTAQKSTVPEDILSLLPDMSVALRKSTIYDTALEQTAVVTFDKRDLLTVLQKKNPAFAEYIQAFKPMADIIDYTIQITDYELETSPETGRPKGFKKLIVEIKPVIDIQKAKIVFVNFNIDTMEKIQAQISNFATLSVRNTPFWRNSVAAEGKVDVKIEE